MQPNNYLEYEGSWKTENPTNFFLSRNYRWLLTTKTTPPYVACCWHFIIFIESLLWWSSYGTFGSPKGLSPVRRVSGKPLVRCRFVRPINYCEQGMLYYLTKSEALLPAKLDGSEAQKPQVWNKNTKLTSAEWQAKLAAMHKKYPVIVFSKVRAHIYLYYERQTLMF